MMTTVINRHHQARHSRDLEQSLAREKARSRQPPLCRAPLHQMLLRKLKQSNHLRDEGAREFNPWRIRRAARMV
jgi:hypothetical protein